jgi:hypothetical protein
MANAGLCQAGCIIGGNHLRSDNSDSILGVALTAAIVDKTVSIE